VRNLKTDLRDELNETMTVREGECDIQVSKQRALVKKLAALAIAGNPRAISTLLSFCARAFGDHDDDDDQQSSPEDREILNAFASRSTKGRAGA